MCGTYATLFVSLEMPKNIKILWIIPILNINSIIWVLDINTKSHCTPAIRLWKGSILLIKDPFSCAFFFHEKNECLLHFLCGLIKNTRVARNTRLQHPRGFSPIEYKDLLK